VDSKCVLCVYSRPPLVATAKAFQTSAQPGLTQALSTRLKLSVEPLIYSFDTPGVMLPFLGNGQEGAERGVKLALIGKCSGDAEFLV
jgi:ribosome biogenesis GTPase A